MKPDLFWIPGPWSGRLALVMRPRGGDWLEDELSGWRNAGVDTLVSLLDDAETAEFGLQREGEFAEAAGIGFISFPICDRSVPDSAAAARLLLSKLTSNLESGRNIAIHCRQGIGRSALIAAAVLVTSGMPPDEAIRVVSTARGRTTPETQAQIEWIRQMAADSPVAAL